MRPCRFVVLVACILLLRAGPAAGLPAEPRDAKPGLPAMPHVRTAKNAIRALIRDGCRRSLTFRTIFEKIEQSDLIVYVETTSSAPPRVVAWLQYEGASAVNRFLRIFVKIPAADETFIALVGHELQHATEVAAAPDVRDQQSLQALYKRTGDWSGEGWDSRAAREVTDLVRDELRGGTDVLRAVNRR